MRIQQYLNLIVGSLVLLNILLAFGAIGLLVRMEPAIERILEENVYSTVAAEEILAEIAAQEGNEFSVSSLERIDNALNRAKVNITEDDEIPVLDRIEKNLEAYQNSKPQARRALIDDLLLLIEINRKAMHRVDQDAKRLSMAGAWAAAFIGFVSFVVSLLIIRQLRIRIVSPIVELYTVLESNRRGDHFRRCNSKQASPEIQQIHYSINRLLDERIAFERPEEIGKGVE